jgi:hypothetical protein
VRTIPWDGAIHIPNQYDGRQDRDVKPYRRHGRWTLLVLMLHEGDREPSGRWTPALPVPVNHPIGIATLVGGGCASWMVAGLILWPSRW